MAKLNPNLFSKIDKSLAVLQGHPRAVEALPDDEAAEAQKILVRMDLELNALAVRIRELKAADTKKARGA